MPLICAFPDCTNTVSVVSNFCEQHERDADLSGYMENYDQEDLLVAPVKEDIVFTIRPNTRLTIVGERIPWLPPDMVANLPDDKKPTTLVEILWHYNNGHALVIVQELSSDDAPSIINEWDD